eukprot:353944-Chlamydomonas_euryale.AAC.2
MHLTSAHTCAHARKIRPSRVTRLATATCLGGPQTGESNPPLRLAPARHHRVPSHQRRPLQCRRRRRRRRHRRSPGGLRGQRGRGTRGRGVGAHQGVDSKQCALAGAELHVTAPSAAWSTPVSCSWSAGRAMRGPCLKVAVYLLVWRCMVHVYRSHLACRSGDAWAA